MAEFEDILNEGKGKLTEDKLLAYLEGKLPPAEQHEIERVLNEEGMESDSIEGLKALSTGETKQIVSKINMNLEQALKKAKRKHKQPVKNNYWAIIAVVVILLICLAGYIVFLLAVKK